MEDYITVQQAALHRGVSHTAIYKAIHDGRLASAIVLGRLAVRRHDVDQLVFGSYRDKARTNVGRRYANPDQDPRGEWRAISLVCPLTKDELPVSYFAIVHPMSGLEVYPPANRTWCCKREEFDRLDRENCIWWGTNLSSEYPYRKQFRNEKSN